MPKRNYIILGLVLVVLAVGAFFWAKNKPTPEPLPMSQEWSTDEGEAQEWTGPIGRSIAMVRVGMFGEKTDFGFVKVPITDKESDMKYLNVAADLNGDGEFAAYRTGEKTQVEWLVQNMPVRFLGEAIAYAFFFPDKSADDRLTTDGALVRAVLTSEPLETDEWDGTVPTAAYGKEKNVKLAFEDVGDLQEYNPERDTGWGGFDNDGYGFFIKAAQAEGKTVNEFNIGVPDIDQKRNECAPTSAANSLIWLAKKYKFEDKMPSQAELIEELKNDMDWDQGIAPNDFLPGKEKITKRRKLPLVNHKIGQFNGQKTFEQMAEELAKGQDVEMRIQYKDARGRAIGGHWVTVVGVESFRSGTQHIQIHDPLSPGPAKLQIYRLDPKAEHGIRIVNYPYGRAYVSFAIAESYFPPEKPETGTPPPPKEDEPKLPEPKEPEDSGQVSLGAQPEGLTFEHQIGASPCPQSIGQVNLTAQGAVSQWKLKGPLPAWLQMATSGNLPGSAQLSFSCILDQYVTQTVETTLEFVPTDGQGASAKVKVTGYIVAE